MTVGVDWPIDDYDVRTGREAAVAGVAMLALRGAGVTELAREVVTAVGRELSASYVCLGIPGARGEITIQAEAPISGRTRGSLMLDGVNHQSYADLVRGPFASVTELIADDLPVATTGGSVMAIGAPIRPDGSDETSALLLAVLPEGQRPAGEDVAYVQTVASLMGAAMETAQRQERLSESEERLKLLEAAGRLGTWEWDIERSEFSGSEALERLHGLEPGTFQPSLDTLLQQIHPDDRDVVVREVESLQKGGSNGVEYRVILADGSTRWLTARASVYQGPDGNPARMIGVCVDDTERHEHAEVRRAVERRVRGFANVAPALLWVGEADGNRTFFNQTWLDFTGRRLEDELGMGWTGAIHAEDVAQVRTAYLEATAQGRAFEREYRLRNAQGEYCWVIDRGKPHLLSDGTIGGYVGSALDITERKRAEESLRFMVDAVSGLSESLDFGESLAHLAELAVPRFADWCAVDVIDEAGKMERIAVMHRDPERVELARRLQQRWPLDQGTGSVSRRVASNGRTEFYPEVRDSVIETIASDEDHLAIIRGLGLTSAVVVPLMGRGRALGAIMFVHAESGRVYDEHDVGIAEDLGRRAGLAVDNARLYTQAQRIEAELREASAAKDEFLGLMSHELRTPITILYGGTRVLRSRMDQLDATTRENMLEDLELESERIFRMVENLLTLAKVELTAELTIEPVLVQRLAQRVVDSHRFRGRRRPVLIEMEEGLPTVAASEAYIEHVLRNLLSNAEKYSPEDTPIEVAVRTRGGRGVHVSVSDRGVGIAPEEVEMIFQRFYRSERTSKPAGGAGMGLAVCKRLVEAMSGEVWARAREGGGLEVGFTVPEYEEQEA